MRNESEKSNFTQCAIKKENIRESRAYGKQPLLCLQFTLKKKYQCRKLSNKCATLDTNSKIQLNHLKEGLPTKHIIHLPVIILHNTPVMKYIPSFKSITSVKNSDSPVLVKGCCGIQRFFGNQGLVYFYDQKSEK